MNKEIFETPVVEIVVLDTENVITWPTSGEDEFDN